MSQVAHSSVQNAASLPANTPLASSAPLSTEAKKILQSYLLHFERACAFRELRCAFSLNLTAMVERLGHVDRSDSDALHQEARTYQRYEEPLALGKIPKPQVTAVFVLAKALQNLATDTSINEVQRGACLRARAALLDSIAREYHGTSLGVLRMLLYEFGEAAIEKASEGRYNQEKVKAACDRNAIVPFSEFVTIYRNLLAIKNDPVSAYESFSREPAVARAFRWCQSELIERCRWSPGLAELRLSLEMLGVETLERSLSEPFPKGIGASNHGTFAVACGNLLYWPHCKRALALLVEPETSPLPCALQKALLDIALRVQGEYYELHQQNIFSTFATRSAEDPWSRQSLTAALGAKEDTVECALRGHSYLEACPRALLAVLLSRSAEEASAHVQAMRRVRFHERIRVQSHPPSHTEVERDIWGISDTDVALLRQPIGEQVHKILTEGASSHAEDFAAAEQVQKLGIKLRLRPALLRLNGDHNKWSYAMHLESLYSRNTLRTVSHRVENLDQDADKEEPLLFPIESLTIEAVSRLPAIEEARSFLPTLELSLLPAYSSVRPASVLKEKPLPKVAQQNLAIVSKPAPLPAAEVEAPAPAFKLPAATIAPPTPRVTQPRPLSETLSDALVAARPRPYIGESMNGTVLNFTVRPRIELGNEEHCFAKLRDALSARTDVFGVRVIERLLESKREQPNFSDLELTTLLQKISTLHAKGAYPFTVIPAQSDELSMLVQQVLAKEEGSPGTVRKVLDAAIEKWDRLRMGAEYTREHPSCYLDLLGRELALLTTQLRPTAKT